MDVMDLTSARTAIRGRRLLLAFACGLALLRAARAAARAAQTLGVERTWTRGAGSLDSASLVQCLTTANRPNARRRSRAK